MPPKAQRCGLASRQTRIGGCIGIAFPVLGASRFSPSRNQIAIRIIARDDEKLESDHPTRLLVIWEKQNDQ